MSDGPLGTVMHLPATYKDSTGALVDPTAVVLTIKLPDLTSVTPAVIHDSTGKFHVDYTTTQSGHHAWAYTSSLGGFGDVFNIGSALPTTALVSLAAAKRHIQVDATDTTDDAEMRDMILSASDMVNSSCGYSVSTTVTEYVTCMGSGNVSLILTDWPVLSVQSITPQAVGSTAVDVSTLIGSDSGIYTLNTGGSFYGQNLVAYTVGRSFVPGDLQELTLILFKWMWETQRAAGTEGMSGFSDEAEGGRWGHPLPERAIAIMQKYERPHV